VPKADPSRIERGDTRWQLVGYLPGRDRTTGGVGRHPALMPDPVDRRGRALGDGLVRRGKGGRHPSKVKLEEIDAVPEPDQPFA
jgi:hypothetical protein